jgi:hypothetical protein
MKTLIVVLLILLTCGIANAEFKGDPALNSIAQQQKEKTVIVQPPPQQPSPPPLPQAPVVYVYTDNQTPMVFKMPSYAYLGTQPLKQGDKIIKAIHYKANGKTLFSKIPGLHEKTYLKWGCPNPKNMRMLVVSKNVNKSFSLSGNVNANSSDFSTMNQYGVINKGSSSNLNTYGSIGPNYSQSWSSQVYDVHFFLIE